MFTQNKNFFGGVMVFLMMLTLSACTYNVNVENPNDDSNQNELAEVNLENADELAIPDLSNQTVDVTDWELVEHNGFQFRSPKGWTFVVNDPNIYSGYNVTRLYTKNTDKKIVIGGIAPDDYYIQGDDSQSINTDVYAEDYIIMEVTVYQKDGMTWDSFFDEVYGGIVAETADYEFFFNSDLDAKVATKITGVYYGHPRIFVFANGQVYDIALHYQNQPDENQVKAIFNTFVNNFVF